MEKVIDLRGRVRVPTGGIVRDPLEAAEPVTFWCQREFRYRQYSLDERREYTYMEF